MHVKKGLYGLKQSAALWFDHAVGTLLNCGLQRIHSDACLFVSKEKDLHVLMHVDDFQIFLLHQHRIDRLLKQLKAKYDIKLVDTNLFLGLAIQSAPSGAVKLSQAHYAKDKL